MKKLLALALINITLSVIGATQPKVGSKTVVQADTGTVTNLTSIGTLNASNITTTGAIVSTGTGTNQFGLTALTNLTGPSFLGINVNGVINTNPNGTITPSLSNVVAVTIISATGQNTNKIEFKNAAGTTESALGSNNCFLAASGSAARPGLSFLAFPGEGFYNAGSSTAFLISAGGLTAQFSSVTGIAIENAQAGGYPTLNNASSGVLQEFTLAPAAPVTNRIYGFNGQAVTSPTNSHFVELGYDLAFGSYFLRTGTNQTGTANATNQPLAIGIGTNQDILIGTNHIVNFTTGIKVGTGSTVTNILTASATLDFPSTTVGAISDLPITVTGAADGDAVQVGAPQGSCTGIIGSYSGFASNNVVFVRFTSTGTAQDPASGTFKVIVTKF